MIFSLYRLLFWIPTIASIVLILVLGSDGLGQRPWISIVWCALAACLQFFSAVFSPVWVVGLVLQVVLAVYLGLRAKQQM